MQELDTGGCLEDFGMPGLREDRCSGKKTRRRTNGKGHELQQQEARIGCTGSSLVFLDTESKAEQSRKVYGVGVFPSLYFGKWNLYSFLLLLSESSIPPGLYVVLVRLSVRAVK